MSVVSPVILQACPDWSGAIATPIKQDASHRRYTRLRRASGESAIEMRAPTKTAEDQRSFTQFLSIATFLRDQGLSAPMVYWSNAETGHALIEDFGTLALSDLLQTDPDRAEAAYARTAHIPLQLEEADQPEGVRMPSLDALVAMVDLTLTQTTWSAAKIEDFQTELAAVLSDLAQGPRSLSLRDFHADNVMWLPDRIGLQQVGLLDFQDAVMLPKGYDLASLFDDPRREVPQEWRRAALSEAAQHWSVDGATATSRVNTLSLFRNLRILGIFHRLSTGGGRPGYAKFLPRTRALIRHTLDDPALAPFAPSVEALLTDTQAWSAGGQP